MKWTRASERLPGVNNPDTIPIKVTRFDGSVYYGQDDDTGIKWLMHPNGNGYEMGMKRGKDYAEAEMFKKYA